MGIEGISGGAMRAMQAIRPAQGAPDLEGMQASGLKVDQEVRQLLRMIEGAAARGGDPEALKALLSQLQNLVQTAPADDAQNATAGKAGGISGAASQEYAARLDDLKKQLETISNAAGAEAGGQSQHNLINQQLNVLGRDVNETKTRDFMNMY